MTSRASTSPMEQPAIHASGLRKSYQSGQVETPVLQGLSIQIAASELTLIEGPSGCGKSTLLALLGGLLRPQDGRVVALGVDLWDLSPRELERFRLQHTGFIFQGFNLFGALTCREQVMLALGYLGIDLPHARRRADEALDEVGMAARAHLLPAQLSGGEKQRVAIARALAKQPQLLFADEPTSALDAANGQQLIRLLHSIARNHRTAVLCVSHDPRLIQEGDRIMQMEDGRIVGDTRTSAREAVNA